MHEQKIIATLLKSREAYEAVHEHLDAGDFSPESNLLLDYIRDYYSRDSAANSVDVDIVLGRLKRKLTNPKHFTLMETTLRNLPEASPANVAKEILEVKRYRQGLSLASALTGGGDRDKVSSLLEQYNKLHEASEVGSAETSEEEVSGLDLPSLVTTHFDRSSLIPIYPAPLNERLDGGAKPGHHILVFAPTEMGKTLFAINMVGGFLHHGLPVLYIGNEDPIADIQMRLASRLTGLNKHEIEADPKAAMAALAGRNVDKFHIVEMSPGTFPRISKLVEKYSPKIVVLDQLRNIDVKSDNRTQALEKAATEARNLAKRCGVLVVSITQAGDSASGRRILTRGDVDGSNVGIPGQCDVMVGIGATEEEEEKGFRTISLPKNKLGGRHDPFTCSVDTQHSKVIDHGTS
jgi:replicative DNA helicase